MDILYLIYGSNNAGSLANHIQSISMLESRGTSGSEFMTHILRFNVLWLKGHLEPKCHFPFLNVP